MPRTRARLHTKTRTSNSFERRNNMRSSNIYRFRLHLRHGASTIKVYWTRQFKACPIKQFGVPSNMTPDRSSKPQSCLVPLSYKLSFAFTAIAHNLELDHRWRDFIRTWMFVCLLNQKLSVFHSAEGSASWMLNLLRSSGMSLCISAREICPILVRCASLKEQGKVLRFYQCKFSSLPRNATCSGP